MICPFDDTIADGIGRKIEEPASGPVEQPGYLKCPSVEQLFYGNHNLVSALLHGKDKPAFVFQTSEIGISDFMQIGIS